MNAAAAQGQPLPRIVRFLETVEGGACPHCGSGGRWIHRFVVEDGRTLGAMSGCVQLFPRSRVFDESMRLFKKQRSYRELGWSLPSWDLKILEAITAFSERRISEDDALREIKLQKSNAALYRGRRGRR